MSKGLVDTRIIQALAILLQPESLSLVLSHASHKHLDLNVIERYLSSAQREGWKEWFRYIKECIEPRTTVSAEDVVVVRYLQEFCDASEISPCQAGKDYLLGLDQENFANHCESCKECDRFKSILGWLPLVNLINGMLEDIDLQIADRLRPKRTIEQLRDLAEQLKEDPEQLRRLQEEALNIQREYWSASKEGTYIKIREVSI